MALEKNPHIRFHVIQMLIDQVLFYFRRCVHHKQNVTGLIRVRLSGPFIHQRSGSSVAAEIVKII